MASQLTTPTYHIMLYSRGQYVCAGTKAAVPEMLESALEHEILHEG